MGRKRGSWRGERRPVHMRLPGIVCRLSSSAAAATTNRWTSSRCGIRLRLRLRNRNSDLGILVIAGARKVSQSLARLATCQDERIKGTRPATFFDIGIFPLLTTHSSVQNLFAQEARQINLPDVCENVVKSITSHNGSTVEERERWRRLR
jgi:hypothetical protein